MYFITSDSFTQKYETCDRLAQQLVFLYLENPFNIRQLIDCLDEDKVHIVTMTCKFAGSLRNVF